MNRKIRCAARDLFISNDADTSIMESRPGSPVQNVINVIRRDIDLAKAIELLRREKRVNRALLELEFNWSNWKARKVYEKLRTLCAKGLAFRISDDDYWICEVHQGYVELIRLTIHREEEDVEIRPDLNPNEEEDEDEEFDESDEEIEE